MKINKVDTLSFAISEKFERNVLDFAEGNPRVRLHKKYLPLAKLGVTRLKKVDKGLLFRNTITHVKRNNLYVDLSTADLYHMYHKGVVHTKPQVEKTDILRKVIDLPSGMLNTLSYILERGSVECTELDQDMVIELARHGLVMVFEPKSNSLFNIMRIAIDESEIREYYVKPAYYLPKFDDRRYDLSYFLETTDTVDNSYHRSMIEYSIEKIARVIRYLSNCDVMLDAIIYIPYLLCEHCEGQGAEVVSHFPLCSKNSKNAKRNYETEVRLKPISLSTELGVMDSTPVEKSTISFSDVGGLENAKKEITESIIYPLTHTKVSQKFGKKTGGGILLYGPPGCGKTQLARAAVGECGVSFFNVNISDIVGEKGEGADEIHRVFEQASKNAPAIIFFDEIDALCSRKSSLDSSKKRILNQFLMDMSGVEGLSEDVLVIAATDTPWELDPALRRSGRFSKRIFIPPPDFHSRIEIFGICTLGKPLSPEVDLEKLAELTEGYSAADIDEICNNAASIPWKKAVSESSERDITMDDFLTAIREQESTLIPWAISAEELMDSSGEKELYRDLYAMVKKLNEGFRLSYKDERKDEKEGEYEDYRTVKRIVSGGPEETSREKRIDGNHIFQELKEEKDKLEHKIQILEERYRQGRVGADIYQGIMEDYQKRLIEIELEMGEVA
ncbi:MAG: ATP-binding protein [Candidatus Altiarchaeota archaeon]|nr:ATP-binding protein [Candidatus Altiarchaeota archaeon]